MEIEKERLSDKGKKTNNTGFAVKPVLVCT